VSAARDLRAQRASSATIVVAVVATSGALGAVAVFDPALALAVAVMAVIAAAIATRPQTAVLLAIFLLQVNAPAVAIKEHGAPFLVGAAVPLLLAVPLAGQLRRREPFVVDRTLILLVVLLLVQVASLLTSSHQDVAVEEIVTFITEGIVLYALVTNAVRTPETLKRVAWTVVAAGAALASLSLYQSITASPEMSFLGFAQQPPEFLSGLSERARASGPIGDPNYYAQVLLPALAIAVVLLVRGGLASRRVLAASAAALVAVAILLTYSRAAGLACVVLLVVLTVLRYVSFRQFAVIAAIVVLLLAAVPGYGERLGQLGGTAPVTSGAGAAADTSAGRATEMLAAALAFGDHPVLGLGPDAFPLEYQRYAGRVGVAVAESSHSQQREGEEPQRAAHNLFLGIAADLGLLGLVAFCAVLGSALWQAAEARRLAVRTRSGLADLATALLLALAVYVVMGLTLSLAYERYLWLLVALASAARSVSLVDPGTIASEGARAAAARKNSLNWSS